MDKRKVSIRELEALVGEHLMGLRIVAHDWPCGRSPNGEYESLSCRSPNNRKRVLWYDTPDYVYLPDAEDLWPPEPSEEDGNAYAYVEPVPFYARNANATRKVVEKVLSDDATAEEFAAYLLSRSNSHAGGLATYSKMFAHFLRYCTLPNLMVAALATKGIYVEVE